MSLTTAPPTQPGYSQFVLKRLPQDDDELWWLVFALWGYRIPRQRVCSNHVAPFDAFAEAFFAREQAAIWKASRGLGGKSRTLGILGLTEATLLGCEVSILGGSASQSLNVHDATKDAWNWHASPRYLLDRPPTRFDTVMTHGGHLRTLTASQTSVRGPHPPRLRMDEIDEMDLDILDATLGQPLPQENWQGDQVQTQTVMSSTHQYPDRTMTEMINRAKKTGWPVHEWCYKETSNTLDGWLTQESIDRARSLVSEIMWKTEYDLQEPSFEGRAIDGDAVDAMWDPSLGVFTGEAMVFAPFVEGRHYLTSIDWAKLRDTTVIATYDTTDTPWLLVAWQRIAQFPWPLLVAKAVAQYRMYGGTLTHDATGVGEAAHDLLREQMSTSEFAKVKPVVMGGGRERDALYTEYISAVEHHDLKGPRITSAYDEHRYVTPLDLFTGKGHAPDSVVAGALAWKARHRRVVLVAPSGGVRAEGTWNV